MKNQTKPKRQLYNSHRIPLPEVINNFASTYDEGLGKFNTLASAFSWVETPEGHEFWDKIEEAKTLEDLWSVWREKFPETL